MVFEAGVIGQGKKKTKHNIHLKINLILQQPQKKMSLKEKCSSRK